MIIRKVSKKILNIVKKTTIFIKIGKGRISNKIFKWIIKSVQIQIDLDTIFETY